VESNHAFATTSGLDDIHSHFVDGCSPNWADYAYSGRLMYDTSGGIGVTFLSAYPASDAYYRLQNAGTSGFEVVAHGTGLTGGVMNAGIGAAEPARSGAPARRPGFRNRGPGGRREPTTFGPVARRQGRPLGRARASAI
jgi:hypothetical protein